MDVNFSEKFNLESILSAGLLNREGEIMLLGLKIKHTENGRVVISDTSKIYSENNYTSAYDVFDNINRAIDRKYGCRK
jgi:hypothetical protein